MAVKAKPMQTTEIKDKKIACNMKYYDLKEKNDILTITFHRNLPDSDQTIKLKLNTYLKDFIANSKCTVLICDLSKSNYEKGAYISCVWLFGLAYNKTVYVIATKAQVDILKSLMKMNIEVPIYLGIDEIPEVSTC